MADVQQIKEVYVGAFTISLDGAVPTETILLGNRCGVFQATIEHDLGAVPRLVSLCDEIATYEGLSWRLLKFDGDGVHELDKADYREYSQYQCHRHYSSQFA